MDGIRLTTTNSKAHRLVRELEQLSFASQLNERGAIWLIADWGMAVKEFIGSTLAALGVESGSLFGIDCSDYGDRESFLVRLGTSLGSSFENVFTAISNYGPSVVVLDDIPLASGGSEVAGLLSSELEKLVSIIQDYAPEAKIVLRSRVSPVATTFPSVALTAFDEPDLAIYVRESEFGDARYGKPEAVGIIYRRTDGVPARVDDALRDLQVTSLADLAATNPDFAETSLITVEVPPSLAKAIAQLKASTDHDAPRAHELLLALSALPYGEQLSRIRRFLGVHPFTTNHARYLLDRGLLSNVTLSGFGESDNAEQVRALTVPRIVREYVISTTPEDRSRAIDSALVTMYFGKKWSQGNIETSATGKRARHALSDGYEINNAITLILRMLLRAKASADDLAIGSILRLAGAFLSALLGGNHYRNVAAFTADVIPLLDADEHAKNIAIFRMQQSRALRMLGKTDRALECSLDIDVKLLSKDQRQEVLVGRTLIYERQGSDDLAAETARSAIAVAPKSQTALHAELVLIEQTEDQEKRISELNGLLRSPKGVRRVFWLITF